MCVCEHHDVRLSGWDIHDYTLGFSGIAVAASVCTYTYTHIYLLRYVHSHIHDYAVAVSGIAVPASMYIRTYKYSHLLRYVHTHLQDYAIGFAGIAVAAFVSNYFQAYCFGVMGEHLTKRIRAITFAAILRQVCLCICVYIHVLQANTSCVSYTYLGRISHEEKQRLGMCGYLETDL